MDSEERFVIRFAKASEIPRVRELILALNEYQKMTIVPRIPTTAQLMNELTRTDPESGIHLSSNHGTFTVVVIDRKRNSIVNGKYILGYLIYSTSYSIRIGRHFYLNSFFLEEDYRRLGLGARLMEFMRTHAKAIGGFRVVDVPVMNDNEKGFKFYSKFNYQKVDDEYLTARRYISDIISAAVSDSEKQDD